MATFNELYDLYSNSDLRNLVQAAVTMKAYNVLQESTPSESRIAWAKTAMQSGQAEAEYLLRYVLCAHADLTVTQILEAADADVLLSVGAAIDKLFP